MSSASSRAAEKFKTWYATFVFNDAANLDEGTMWPTSFALKGLTAADEAKIAPAREEGGELRTELATGPALGGMVRALASPPRDPGVAVGVAIRRRDSSISIQQVRAGEQSPPRPFTLGGRN